MGSIHEKYGKNLLTLSLQNQWNNVNKLNNYLFLTSAIFCKIVLKKLACPSKLLGSFFERFLGILKKSIVDDSNGHFVKP